VTSLPTSDGHGPSRASASPRRASGLVAALIVSLLVVAVGGVLVLVFRASGRSRTVAESPAGRLVAGRSVVSTDGAADVELRVTQDFGATPMIARQVAPRPLEDVLALVSRQTSVTTSYGGGFVGSIAGIASGYTGATPVREDWFFYVNGLQAHTGAGEIAVSANDRIWWDFHAWDFAASVPAVVGQFPAPFVAGTGTRSATQVLFADGFAPQATAIVSALRSAGATSAVAAPVSAAALGQPGHTILVGRFDQLDAFPAVRDAAKRPQGSGVFARFSDNGVDALGVHGETALHAAGAGAVMATAKPADADGALWLVTGSDAADVRSAAALLTDGGARLAGRFGALVTRDGAVESLPMATRR